MVCPILHVFNISFVCGSSLNTTSSFLPDGLLLHFHFLSNLSNRARWWSKFFFLLRVLYNKSLLQGFECQVYDIYHSVILYWTKAFQVLLTATFLKNFSGVNSRTQLTTRKPCRSFETVFKQKFWISSSSLISEEKFLGIFQVSYSIFFSISTIRRCIICIFSSL